MCIVATPSFIPSATGSKKGTGETPTVLFTRIRSHAPGVESAWILTQRKTYNYNRFTFRLGKYALKQLQSQLNITAPLTITGSTFLSLSALSLDLIAIRCLLVLYNAAFLCLQVRLARLSRSFLYASLCSFCFASITSISCLIFSCCSA